jgi:hypothetical protein
MLSVQVAESKIVDAAATEQKLRKILKNQMNRNFANPSQLIRQMPADALFDNLTGKLVDWT